VGLYALVAALVEVAPHGLAGPELKTGEELGKILQWNGIGGSPAAFDIFGNGMNIGMQGLEADQIPEAAAKALQQQTVGVDFNVEIPIVTVHGTQIDLQTAVVVGEVQFAGVLCLDVDFLGGQTDIQVLFVVAHLALGFNSFGGHVPQHMIEGGDRDFIPVQNLRLFDDNVFSHNIGPFLQVYQ